MLGETSVSIIIPVFNEGKNINLLYAQLQQKLPQISKFVEIIFVNDGSFDQTSKVLQNIKKANKKVKVVSLKRNYGKTFALETGIKFSKGEIIVTLDSDLQHDPNDMPKLIRKISEGYDVVTGWRTKRRDPLPRIIFSKVVNFFVFLLTGFYAHDFYCGFKCYRREIVKRLNFHGDVFRFIALLASRKGFKTAEVPIAYRYRKFGKSKYGWQGLVKRTFYDLLIIISVVKGWQIPFVDKLVRKKITYEGVVVIDD